MRNLLLNRSNVCDLSLASQHRCVVVKHFFYPIFFSTIFAMRLRKSFDTANKECIVFFCVYFPSMNFAKPKCNHIFEGHSTDQRRNYRHIVNAVWVRQISIKWKEMKEEKNAERKGKQGRDRVKQAHTHTHPPKRIKYGGCYLLFYECFELFPNNAIHIYVYNDAHTLSITWSRFFPLSMEI